MRPNNPFGFDASTAIKRRIGTTYQTMRHHGPTEEYSGRSTLFTEDYIDWRRLDAVAAVAEARAYCEGRRCAPVPTPPPPPDLNYFPPVRRMDDPYAYDWERDAVRD